MHYMKIMVLVVTAIFAGLWITEATALSTSSISMGQNPLFSIGDYVTSGHSVTLSNNTAMAMRITDVHLTVSSYNNVITATTSSGVVIAKWFVDYSYPLIISMESGLVVPAGENVVFTAGSSYTVYMTVAGQYIQP